MNIPNPSEKTRALVYRGVTGVIVIALVVATFLGFDLNEIVTAAVAITAAVTTAMASLNTSIKPPAPPPVEGGEIV